MRSRPGLTVTTNNYRVWFIPLKESWTDKEVHQTGVSFSLKSPKPNCLTAASTDVEIWKQTASNRLRWKANCGWKVKVLNHLRATTVMTTSWKVSPWQPKVFYQINESVAKVSENHSSFHFTLIIIKDCTESVPSKGVTLYNFIG